MLNVFYILCSDLHFKIRPCAKASHFLYRSDSYLRDNGSFFLIQHFCIAGETCVAISKVQ